MTLEGGEKDVGASEVGEDACFWISVSCLQQWVRNQHIEGISAEAGHLVGQTGLTVKKMLQATGRLESSKGKSAQHKAAVCQRRTTFPGYPVLFISHMFLLV